jgi:hypothetical protein
MEGGAESHNGSQREREREMEEIALGAVDDQVALYLSRERALLKPAHMPQADNRDYSKAKAKEEEENSRERRT